MPSVSLKVKTLLTDEVATQLQDTISRIKGVSTVQADTSTHNLTVSWNEGVDGTSLTAIQVALQLAKHPHSSFSAGARKRGWV